MSALRYHFPLQIHRKLIAITSVMIVINLSLWGRRSAYPPFRPTRRYPLPTRHRYWPQLRQLLVRLNICEQHAKRSKKIPEYKIFTFNVSIYSLVYTLSYRTFVVSIFQISLRSTTFDFSKFRARCKCAQRAGASPAQLEDTRAKKTRICLRRILSRANKFSVNIQIQ